MLGMTFHSQSIYDRNYRKAKVKTFNSVVNPVLQNDKVPKKDIYYTCIAGIKIDSVMKMNRKNYPQVYSEECKHEIKKKNKTRFIVVE